MDTQIPTSLSPVRHRPGRAPGPRTWWNPLGVFGAMARDPIALFMDLRANYGDIARFRVGPKLMHLVSHPDLIHHVFQEKGRSYTKGWDYVFMKPVLGNGLLMSEGDFWRSQRKLMQPAFHQQQIRGFVQVMAAAADRVATRWERAARAGEPVDVAADMMRLTLEVVAACLFGAGIGEEDSRLVGLRLTEAVEAIFKQTFGPPFLAKLPTPSHRRLARAVRDLDRVVVGLIQARRAQLEAGAEVRHDLLDTLISATDPDTGRGLSETQLRDEAMTLFLAGHETTASHLAWTFHLLGTRPEEQEKLGSEARGVIGEKAVAMEDLARLEFCRRVLDESLRLYPPAWWISRTPQVDDEVAGFGIKKGSVVVMSPYVVHRHPAFWDDPERFDPDRFLPQRVQARPKLAYVPFGAGPRFCIGNVFAQVESQIVLSTLMSRFRVEPVEGNVVRRSPQVTLRPSGGPVMRITLR